MDNTDPQASGASTATDTTQTGTTVDILSNQPGGTAALTTDQTAALSTDQVAALSTDQAPALDATAIPGDASGAAPGPDASADSSTQSTGTDPNANSDTTQDSASTSDGNTTSGTTDTTGSGDDSVSDDSAGDTDVSSTEAANAATTQTTATDATTATGGSSDSSGQTTAVTDSAPAATAAVVLTPAAVLAATIAAASTTTASAASTTIADAMDAASPNGKAVLSNIDSYLTNMKPGKPLTSQEGARHQVQFYRTMVSAINNLEEDFNHVFGTILKTAHEHADGVFHATRRCRFVENVALPEHDRKTFTRLMNLLSLTADPAARKVGLTQVDLTATLEGQTITERGRQKIMAFFGK